MTIIQLVTTCMYFILHATSFNIDVPVPPPVPPDQTNTRSSQRSEGTSEESADSAAEETVESHTDAAWLPPGAEGTHLLVVDWDSQSERTRMTQALEPHDSDHIVQPPGTVRILTDEIDKNELMSSLLTKVPPEHVYLQSIEPDPDLESAIQTEAVLEYTFNDRPDDISTALNFIITNRGGRLKSPTEQRYKITRNGYVEVEFEIVDDDAGTVELLLDGQSEPVAALKETLLTDLKQLDDDWS